jgi:hypothetical protein
MFYILLFIVYIQNILDILTTLINYQKLEYTCQN